MPLLKVINIETACKIAVWKIDESLDELITKTNNGYKDVLKPFKNESRKKQSLACRILLQKLLINDEVSVDYDKNGKPFLRDSNYHISISHTNEFVAVIMGQNRVGIDIEKIHPRIHKTRKRFVTESEEHWLSNSNSLEEQLFLIWGAKEAMLKIIGDRRIDFQKNMWVSSFDYAEQGCFESHMKYLNINKKYNVEYQKIDNHLLVYIVD